ncbi:hypothetical protein NliqN6_1897 [Naganishia liquefaciens]|uniref:Uncharacterized protein n=1 Tax=Naganishia liquefaciens TaxID=104408 RepID=A0A8H3YDI9_9TREE|nr:hypothetical protein NliqN6_1897 [Naganishia liquefaciens]
MNSAVTRTEGYFSGPYSQADVVSTVCSLAAEQHSWTEAYQNGQSTRDLLRRLLDGHKCDPYVLSEDGLLYAYVPEPDSDLEVSRLVPPEGRIRRQLLLDAKRQLRVSTSAVRLSVVELAKRMMDSLSANYWWIGMEKDILSMARQDDEVLS